jgi:signal transduction histidine kinase
MRFFRRSLLALGVAAMLPTLVFAAVATFYFLRTERARIETATLGRSELVMMLIDARLERDLAALNVLSTSIHLHDGDWAELYPHVQRVLQANPGWHTIQLIDTRQQHVIFDLQRPLGEPQPIDANRQAALRAAIRAGIPTPGDIGSTGSPQAWVHVPVLEDGQVKYLFAAAIKPQVFQDILLAFAQSHSTAAVVDRNGHFLARNVDYESRVGTPATHYVRDALKSGGRGFYRGITYEGLSNYTAFHTSAWSGWSAHLAVASALIDTPTAWSFIVAALAGLCSVLLGAALVMLVLRDMAERRRAEETMRQSQKMEAIGQLTGGIAHDFNNLLTAVIGNLDMIRTRTADNERLQYFADNALQAARRGAKLASQLLAFSRTQRMAVDVVDLEKLLNGMHGLLRQSIGPAIEMRVRIDADARTVLSDANQLELALLNLAVNARDAMPDGGVLTIEARRVADPALPESDYVSLSVQDTGAGMPEDIRSRAIEPFFTTKPVGQGTGLGLSQVYGVVRESGGSLAIDSEPGRGTTMRLLLRRAQPDSESARSATQGATPTVPLSTRQARVLVVDDDKLVRRFMTECLRTLGYEVVEAESGAAALEILDRERVDLLLVDFAMPGMNGAEVARAAQIKQPGLEILMVSGYADSAAVEAAIGTAPQLRKPFDLVEIGAAVAKVLSSK